MLDLSSYGKAIAALADAIKARETDPAQGLFLDAAIQRFEFTYELSWKTLKRFLEMTGASEEAVDTLSFADLIRTGNEHGLLLNDWTRWSEYRNARNKTSHTYDENKALEVYRIIPSFLDEAKYLYAQINARQSE